MKNYYAKPIIEMIQNLDEIGGPDSAEQYIETLELIKAKIDEMLENAKQNFPGV